MSHIVVHPALTTLCCIAGCDMRPRHSHSSSWVHHQDSRLAHQQLSYTHTLSLILTSTVQLCSPCDESVAVGAPVLCVEAAVHAEWNQAAAEYAAGQRQSAASQPRQCSTRLPSCSGHVRAAVRTDCGDGIVRPDALWAADDEQSGLLPLDHDGLGGHYGLRARVRILGLLSILSLLLHAGSGRSVRGGVRRRSAAGTVLIGEWSRLTRLSREHHDRGTMQRADE